MSLDANWSKIEGFDSLTDDEKVTRNSLTFATMGIGMNRITAENVREFYTRLSLWEKVNGSMRYDGTERVYFTYGEVVRFVGLSTNASTLTKAKFLSSLWDNHDRFNVYHDVKEFQNAG